MIVSMAMVTATTITTDKITKMLDGIIKNHKFNIYDYCGKLVFTTITITF